MIKAIIFDCYGVLDLDRLNHDILPIIDELGRTYRLGILTNSHRDELDRFLASHRLRHKFDVLLASSQTRYVKPQREIFEILAERLDLDFYQILFIDDSPVNTAAAERYGMATITYRDPDQLAGALILAGVL